MGDRLATIGTGRKVGRGSATFGMEQLGPHLTMCPAWLRPTSVQSDILIKLIHPAISPQ